MAEAAVKNSDADHEPAARRKANAAPTKTDVATRADGPLADALNEGGRGSARRGPSTSGSSTPGPSILGIEVDVQFVLGHASVAVGTLMDMAQAHVLVMDRDAGDPVDVVVNGTRIAEGELVGEGDGADLGVRITRICDDRGENDDG